MIVQCNMCCRPTRRARLTACEAHRIGDRVALVRLTDSDIRTREVLSWKGVHVFHALFSSCSQKLRIFLNLKNIAWISHVLDLGRIENLSEFYLGINPRGLVPCLIHDGQVHIESNEIILHLERAFPEPMLIPSGCEMRIAGLLKHEDDLHLDMRSVTFRFLFPPSATPRMSPDALKRYATSGSGTVQGMKDPQIAREIAYWQKFEAHGISDETIRDSVQRLRAAFENIDRTLEKSAYLEGKTLSVMDIAWFVYVHRLRLCGYPLSRLHASLNAWYMRLALMPQIGKEVILPSDLGQVIEKQQSTLRSTARHLEAVCEL
jgi:glutathione S-transferase